MSYQALYRKWRPGRFEDVKGQDHIVTTLRNQLLLDRVGHAYLFCGTRGTGKTSVAKIFAKAVNCLTPVNGSPCNTCEMCKAINNQTSMNVIEIDAASNNGVDNIREIREEVEYSPTEGKFKVYIIDEVHMLSIGAFNALLKTLEEPPSYVIFVLATTEAHKIPITILSRCQRYDFRRITIETIAVHLEELVNEENLDIEDKAISYIAKAADGSMRDALSLLDQCVAFYLGERLTYDKVLEVLGAVDTEVFSRLLKHIIRQELTNALRLIEEVIIQGRELTQFVTDFIWYLRNLLLVKNSEDIEDVLEMSAENMNILKEEAQNIDGDILMRYIRIFSELSGQIKYSSQKRVLIEVALIKLCKPSMERNFDSVLNRLALIEKQLESGIVAAAPNHMPSQIAMAEASSIPAEEIKPRPQAAPEDIQAIIGQWGAILSDLPTSMSLMLKTAMINQGPDNKIILGFNEEMNKSYFDNAAHKNELEHVLSEKIEKQIEIISQMIAGEKENTQIFFDPNKVNLQGVDIVYEDE